MSTTADDKCQTCGALMAWEDCTECGGAIYVEHDCGEDTCACANPEPNVRCKTCDGDEGWLYCPECYPRDRP